MRNVGHNSFLVALIAVLSACGSIGAALIEDPKVEPTQSAAPIDASDSADPPAIAVAAEEVDPLVAALDCTVYVDQESGSDANSGRERGAALATIAEATGIVVAGDKVCVFPGNYSEFENTTDGTPDARIHYVSVEKWQAKVSSSTDSVIRNLGKYVDIEGFEVTAYDRTITAGIVNGDGAHANHVRIFNNHVYGVDAYTTPGNGGAGIISVNWTSSEPYQGTDVEIFNNWVHDIGAEARPDYKGFVHGIYISHPNAKIYNNIVHDISGFSIHGWHNARDVTVSNNFSSNSLGFVMGVGDSPCDVITCVATGYIVTNNVLFYDDRSVDLRGSGNVNSNNAFFGGPSNGSNAVDDDPQFVDPAAHDFHLQPTSPLIDAGDGTFAPSFGFDGSARPNGGAPDIGPYEN